MTNTEVWLITGILEVKVLTFSTIKEKEKGESEKCRLGCGEEGKYQEEGKK